MVVAEAVVVHGSRGQPAGNRAARAERAGVRCSGPFPGLYSPECVEGVFSEVHLQDRA
jgi:hypothetical protein